MPDNKINLISSSWSDNARKGFYFYQYLDQNLNFDKYKMTFVGNSPIKFRNIKQIPPVNSAELAEILKKHDIFVFASRNEPCSNALLEALACGLPVVALDSGSNRELIKMGGEVFSDSVEMIQKIDVISNNYRQYQSQIPEYRISVSSDMYLKFFERLYSEVIADRYSPKRITLESYLKFLGIKFFLGLFMAWNSFTGRVSRLCRKR